jgi:hypothetical protein
MVKVFFIFWSSAAAGVAQVRYHGMIVWWIRNRICLDRCFWHISEVPDAAKNARFSGKGVSSSLRGRKSEFDPKRVAADA